MFRDSNNDVTYTYNYEYKTQFFTHITNRVVVAVTEGDLANVQVVEMLRRVTEWSVPELEMRMMVTLLSWGPIIYTAEGHVLHKEAQGPQQRPLQGMHRVDIRGDDAWSVFSVDREILAEGESIGLHLYAAMNVGPERWCVLASDFHTLFHILRNHNMSAEHLMGCDSCDPSCSQRQDNLVPRVRPRFRFHPGQFRHPSSLQPLRRQNSRMMHIVQTVLTDNKQARNVIKSNFVYYLSEYDWDTDDESAGWCIIAGFSITHRKHLALGRFSFADQPHLLLYNENDSREFLQAVGPLLRARELPLLENAFLRGFTQANPVRWSEAVTIISSMSLRDLAYCKVLRLPNDYLQRHAPSQLCRTVNNMRNLLPWKMNSEMQLKPIREKTWETHP